MSKIMDLFFTNLNKNNNNNNNNSNNNNDISSRKNGIMYM